MSRAPQLPARFFEENFHSAARHALDNRECIRLLGLAFLQQKRSVKETAKAFNVSSNAVHEWVHRYKCGGLQALKDQGGRGRKKCLPVEEEGAFKAAVMEAQQKKEGGSITGQEVENLLKERFHVECKKTAVYSLLHRVGLSWISGRSRHKEQNQEAQTAFKKTSANV